MKMYYPDNMRPALRIAIAAAIILSVSPTAQAATNWVNTGSKNTAGFGSTATLLPNGKVLVAGGANEYGRAFMGASLYDPASGTWTYAGLMKNARESHTATLLPNGKVLVAGGTDSNSLASAELYDPTSGAWTETASMKNAHSSHTATLLPNGKVLVAGGFGASDKAELYDPASGTWTNTGSLNIGRDQHTATLLRSGKVLVAGGEGSASPYHYSSAELYDPATGAWTWTGSMNIGRCLHTATLLTGGQVLVAGGWNPNISPIATQASVELYDPASGMWTMAGRMNDARLDHTATLMPDGRVLVAGGNNDFNPELASAELYSPASDAWTNTGSLNSARWRHTATLLPNGQVLVAAGDNGLHQASAELYDPASGTCKATGSMTAPSAEHAATLLPNGKVLVSGGNDEGQTPGARLYDPAGGTWTNTGSMHDPRIHHTATLLPNGRVLVAGGSDDLASAELYNSAIGTWMNTGSMNTARWVHTATLLPNGKVLVAGGRNSIGYLAGAELYETASGTWAATGPLNTARWWHTATLLPDGKVLVAGGSNTNGYLASAELYDPGSGTWTNTGSMNGARQWHSATLLPNGRVLVAGGEDNSAELYDPASETWKNTGSMNTARTSHTATLLPNGKVLVAGGWNPDTRSYLASTELYDPATGTWTATDSLNPARTEHTATLLPNGKVLIAGGWNADLYPGYLANAELYDVGLGFNASWQPQIATATSPLNLGDSLTLTGSGFRGISEGSGGNTSQDSPSDFPVVQLYSLANEQTLFVPAASWSTNAFTSGPVTGLPPGPALVTVFVNGIPSRGNMLIITDTPPTVTITSPMAGQLWSNNVFTVTGTASDNVQVDAVYYQINGLGWNLATNASYWTASVNLIAGTNIIQARAIDSNGNISATNSAKLVAVLSTTLKVGTNGLGTLNPNYNNALLQVGKSYSIAASPGSGFRFTNWTGGITLPLGWLTNGTTVQFAMRSNLMLQANFVDTSKPTLSITNLSGGQRVTNAVFTVKGTATDNWQVSNVVCQLNNPGWTNAVGTTNWSAGVNLTPGTNRFAAYAVDTTGNHSAATNSVSFQFVVTNLLSVRTNGMGSFSPTNTQLEVGRNYSLTATPATGFVFTNWTIATNFDWSDGVKTNNATVQFMMASNLTLQVNFADIAKPTLSITNLTAGQRVTNAVFTVKGTASDNWQVGNVVCQLNGGVWNSATNFNNWTNWAAGVTLLPGTNTVKAYAVDTTGNLSTTGSVSFQYVVTNLLSLRANGLGTYSPTNTQLEVGRNYSLTATPATGFIVTNWTISTNWLGGVKTNNSTVKFMMASNLTLEVNFADVSKPTLTITAPANMQKMTNALATVVGTASDNWKVNAVWYQLTNAIQPVATWNPATSTNNYTNWTTTVTLAAGTNTVMVYAVDPGGNYSTTGRVSVISSNTFQLQFKFNMPQPLTSTGLNFGLQLSPGLNGRIQTSTNLENWITLTNFVGTNSTLNFRDSEATNLNRRFYRAVIP